MKKIIATVLAMVMALALCATAFAATTTNSVDGKDYTMKTMTNDANEYVITKDTQITITKQDATKVTEGTKTTTTYYADRYTIKTDKYGTETYYACDASIATSKLIKDGKVVAYLSADKVLEKGITAVVTKTVEGKKEAKWTCGDYQSENDVFVIDGKGYVVGGSNVAMLNGLAVTYGAEVKTKSHDVDWTKKDATATPSYNAKGEVVSVKCACGTTFEVVKKVSSSYTGDVEKVGNYYVLLGSTNPAGNNGSANSPKTFDAGVAMYAGMALMSVAGSAVVIGKKKEF